jgi:hypothetical protein
MRPIAFEGISDARVVTTDAHRTRESETTQRGIDPARRAALEQSAVLKLPALGNS